MLEEGGAEVLVKGGEGGEGEAVDLQGGGIFPVGWGGGDGCLVGGGC